MGHSPRRGYSGVASFLVCYWRKGRLFLRLRGGRALSRRGTRRVLVRKWALHRGLSIDSVAREAAGQKGSRSHLVNPLQFAAVPDYANILRPGTDERDVERRSDILFRLPEKCILPIFRSGRGTSLSASLCGKSRPVIFGVSHGLQNSFTFSPVGLPWRRISSIWPSSAAGGDLNFQTRSCAPTVRNRRLAYSRATNT